MNVARCNPLGCLVVGAYGLMVTLGSYTNQALDFAKSKSSIQILDGAKLVPGLKDAPRSGSANRFDPA